MEDRVVVGTHTLEDSPGALLVAALKKQRKSCSFFELPGMN